MCLSNAYRKSDNKLLMKQISYLEVVGDEIIARDLFGGVQKIRGQILSVDFEKNTLVINCAEEGA